MTERDLKRLDFAKNSIELHPYNNIHASAFIDRTAIIGKDGFGWARDIDKTLVKVNHAGNVVIEKDVEIRAYCTIDRAVNGSTIIGDSTKIDHGCHIAHNVVIGKRNTIAAHCVIEGSCIIGNHNTFGANVTVQRKVKIGNNCIIGSGAVVTKDVSDFSVIVGNPGRVLKMIQ